MSQAKHKHNRGTDGLSSRDVCLLIAEEAQSHPQCNLAAVAEVRRR